MINGHGDDTYKYRGIRANFSSNVYGQFDHELLFCHLADRLDDVISYPEPEPRTLERELAGMLGVGDDEISVTNGATEAIYLIAQVMRRSRTAILMPTFAEYADACRLHEHKVAALYSLDVIPTDAELVWICNPNNPTGTVVDKDRLMEIMMRHTDVKFVIDQSYEYFTQERCITCSEAVRLSNVILISSMTKRFAIPGLRLGYAVANKALMQMIRLQRMPWSVNQIAITAGRYLLAHEDEYAIDIAELMNERKRVAEALERTGIVEVWPSQSHILLCRLRMGTAAGLKDYLAEEWGLLIRDASNFSGLDSSFFRIAVQGPEEDNLLIEGIESFAMEG